MIAKLEFSNDFLNSLTESFGKRQKSIKYKTRLFSFQKSYEYFEQKRYEKAEVYFIISRLSENSTSFEFYLEVWEDRWLIFQLKGMVGPEAGWERTYQGRFIHVDGPRQILRAIEQSMGATSKKPISKINFLDKIWKPIIAVGPEKI